MFEVLTLNYLVCSLVMGHHFAYYTKHSVHRFVVIGEYGWDEGENIVTNRSYGKFRASCR